jgi:hypothetical protein
MPIAIFDVLLCFCGAGQDDEADAAALRKLRQELEQPRETPALYKLAFMQRGLERRKATLMGELDEVGSQLLSRACKRQHYDLPKGGGSHPQFAFSPLSRAVINCPFLVFFSFLFFFFFFFPSGV